MIQKSHLVILLFLIIISNLKAQIVGKVIDSSDKTPLEYATVAIYDVSNDKLVTGVITNEKGNFTIDKIKKGVYKIEISFIGYQPKVITNVNVQTNNQNINLNTISLVLGNQLSEIIIKSEKSVLVHKIDKQVYDTERFQNSQGSNAIEVIRNLPSISIDGLGNISVRGSQGFAVLLNGKPTQGNLTSILAQLPANALEKVEIITAPSAKYDPEGKAGILNILTKKGSLIGSYTQVNVRLGAPSIEPYDTQVPAKRYGIDLTYNKTLEKWNFSLGGSYQRNDISGRRVGDVFIINQEANTQTFLPSDGERSFDEVNYNGRFSVDFIPNQKNNFTLGVFLGKRTKERLADITYFDNRAVSPIGSDSRLYTFSYYNHNLRVRRGDFALTSLDYNHIFSNDAKLSTSILYEYGFLGGPTFNDNVDTPAYNIIYQKEFNTNDNPLNGVRFNLDYEFQPLSFGKVEVGYQYRMLNHTGDFVYERDGVLVPEFSSNINLKRNINAVYTQFSGKKDKWNYAAGVRLENMDRVYKEFLKSETNENVYNYDYTKLFPSASIQYNVNKKTTIKAAYSKRVERTTTLKMNSFAEREHSEVFEQGDNQLRPEFIDLIEVGFTKKLRGNNSVFATAYFRNTENAINRVNSLAYQQNGAVIDSILNRVYSNVGRAKAIGLEAGSQFKFSDNWSNFIGVNFYNYQVKGVFIFKHRDGITRNYPIDNSAFQYSFNLNSTYKFWKNASLQFTLNYLSERRTAQGKDSRFYSPNLTFRKTFLNNQLTAILQWQNIDLGLLNTQEQSITTSRPDEFYTYTNYIYEVDRVFLNLSYTFNNNKNKSKFIDSEFGKKEF
jgi:iron complex outermembrane receptor protein